MSDLREKFKNFLDINIKKQDDVAISTTRLILAAIKDRDIEYRSKNEENQIPDSEVLNLLQNMVKQRKESVKIYQDANRLDLKEREQKEIKIIENFLPKQIDEEKLIVIIDEVCSEINASSIQDLGKLINILKDRYPGQLDLKKVAFVAREKLSK